jgi:hypothetical protein
MCQECSNPRLSTECQCIFPLIFCLFVMNRGKMTVPSSSPIPSHKPESCTERGQAYPLETTSIRARPASLTIPTCPRHPFDTYPIPDLDSRLLGRGSHLYDLANTFVTTNLALLGRSWHHFPRVHHDAHVGVADTAVGAGTALVVLNSKK